MSCYLALHVVVPRGGPRAAVATRQKAAALAGELAASVEMRPLASVGMQPSTATSNWLFVEDLISPHRQVRTLYIRIGTIWLPAAVFWSASSQRSHSG